MPKKKELSDDDQALRVRLGAAIRVVSGRRGLKPADLAAAAGVSLAHQYRVEGGEQTADLLYLVKVAALLGTTIDALLQQAQTEVVLTPMQPSIAVRGSRNVVAGRDVVQAKARR